MERKINRAEDYVEDIFGRSRPKLIPLKTKLCTLDLCIINKCVKEHSIYKKYNMYQQCPDTQTKPVVSVCFVFG